MNFYVRTINDVVDHIEQNISEPLTLHSISGQFYLSEFHFSRLFKMITGTTVKQYILGRKLTLAAEKLRDTQNTVTDVAYELGFEYPEVFSRDFKKWFGMAPTVYRSGHGDIALMPKAFVVDRDIMNYQGRLTLKETYMYLDEQNLHGVCIEVDENTRDFNQALQTTGERFFTDKLCDCFKGDCFYTVVSCYGDESGRYTVFYGGKLMTGNECCHLKIRTVPAGWYACFQYHGDMLDMRTTFNNDFYQWMLTKEIEPCPNGIGMLNVYDRQDMQSVRILVPVKRPK